MPYKYIPSITQTVPVSLCLGTGRIHVETSVRWVSAGKMLTPLITQRQKP